VAAVPLAQPAPGGGVLIRPRHWFGGHAPFEPDEDADAFIARIFKPSKFPEQRCLFSWQRVVAPTTHSLFDPKGSPYCGLTAIDLALKRMPNLEEYATWRTTADPTSAGTAEQLENFAYNRGVNLRILLEVGNDWQVRHESLNHGPWKTINLVLRRPGADPGHYYLVTENRSSIVEEQLPRIDEPRWWWYHQPVLFGLIIASIFFPRYSAECVTAFMLAFILGFFNVTPILDFSDPEYRLHDHHVRDCIQKRDEMKTLDAYSNVTEGWWLRFVTIRLFKVYVADEYTISVQRFLPAYREAQHLNIAGLPVAKCLPLVTNLHHVMTDESIPGIFENTAWAVKLTAVYTSKRSKPIKPGTIVGYNAHACEVVVYAEMPPPQYVPGADGRPVPVEPNPPQSIQRAAVRQAAGLIGGLENHVARAPAEITFKVNKPIAVSMVQVLTDEGPIGPGMYPLTDEANLLSAFVLRSMTAKEKIPEAVANFVRFSMDFLRRYVDSTRVESPEPDQIERYRIAQRGKRNDASVQRTIDGYEAYKRGDGNKTVSHHSAFVKFENSAKFRDNGEIGCKPRLIMTMSDQMAIECSPVLDLIHAWNHGDFARFQVKDLTPEEMVAKIMDATNGPHNVSDYSSFEASVDWAIRKIELFALTRLCKRACYFNTLDALRRHAFGGRTLRAGKLHFRIFSRCSGDYWTSFGNGVVNVCIMAYNAHLRGIDPHSMRMLAEGDDGIVDSRIPDSEVINSLGFGFSSNLSGARPGDCDFLRSRWVDGKRLLNVGRCFNAFWVKKAAYLKPEKQKFLMRCIANSLHHLSPHHPVVEAIVCRLLRESVGAKRFKGYKKYLETWGAKDYREIKKYTYSIDESMRTLVAVGAGEFPPLPYASQLLLEQSILHDDVVYVGNMLDSFDDFLALKRSGHKLRPDYPRQIRDLSLVASIPGCAVRWATQSHD
jgi:hypothetical protein